MKATDLRIGNFVYIPDTKQIAKIFTINEILGVQVNNNLLTMLSFNEISPIKLTPEKLIEFGFERQELDDVTYFEKENHHNFIICDFDNGEGLVKSTSTFREKVKPLKHVHQLQNMFYYYEGVELLS